MIHVVEYAHEMTIPQGDCHVAYYDVVTPQPLYGHPACLMTRLSVHVEAQLTERRVAFTVTPEARAWLAKKGYDPVYGARPLARVIQTEVRDPLTDEILFGKLEQGGTVTLGLEGEKITFSIDPGKVPEPVPQKALTPEG